MGTLFDPHDRATILQRIDSLTPDRRPRWGRMSPAEMVCHVSCALRQGLGEFDTGTPRGPLTMPPFNWLLIHVLPWPRGKAQSPPEFLGTAPGAWHDDVATLGQLVERFGARGAEARWPASLAFGRISGRSWGVLQHKHLDHHLRQFGA